MAPGSPLEDDDSLTTMSNAELRMTNDLKPRTKRFALDIIRCVSMLPDRKERWAIVQQLIRCGSSVGANYRAACRARSRADFLAKLSIVEEEADETSYWLELLEELGIGDNERLKQLKDEASQLTAIVVASKKTARANGRSGSSIRHSTPRPAFYYRRGGLDIRH